MSGVVMGGWGFVWAAYAVTALALGGYALVTAIAYRREKALAARRAGKETP